MRPLRIVIVGGNAAGMSAAAKAKRTQPDLEITVFEKGRFVSFGACGIPYFLTGAVPRLEDLLARTPEQFAAQGITVRTRHEVTALDLGQHTVTVADREENRTFQVSYDRLLLATGASPRWPDLPDLRGPNVFSLRTLEEALALKTLLDRESPRHATLLGAGYLNLEMAEALRARGLEVTLVEAQKQVMGTLDPEMAALVEEELHRLGVVLRCSQTVQGVETDAAGRVRRVVTAQERWETDLLVVGVGVKPNVALAAAAGIERDGTGAIRTDRRMRTDRFGVYAAGDCVSVPHLVTGQRAYLPLALAANRQGRVAGTNLAGGQAEFHGVVGTAVAKVGDLGVAHTGLSEAQARALFPTVAAQITASDRARYYPGAAPLTVRLVAERGSGRLLGGQIVGPPSAVKRIDVIAAALHARLTVEDLEAFDLAYAPPLSPVWDPLLIAAQVLLREL
jgi:NADPH-dependent 2,4-dienoyl-CoA reductase/sulfur reductase-like enzyme